MARFRTQRSQHSAPLREPEGQTRGCARRAPGGIIALINEWRRDAVSLFFPGLVDSLEKLIAYLRDEDALNATLMLGDIRMSLRQKIINPLPQSQTNAVTLEAIWLDLTLERIGYILFGEVSNVILADITIETLPTAIDVIRSMILSVRAKGQGTWQLEECDAELAAIKQSGDLNFYTIYSVVERINAEIGAIIDKTVETYYDVTKRIFAMRQRPERGGGCERICGRSVPLDHASTSLGTHAETPQFLANANDRVDEAGATPADPGNILYQSARIKHDMEALAKRSRSS